MTTKSISPLSASRMIERHERCATSCLKTQSDYIRHVKNFTIFLGARRIRRPAEDLRAYQVHSARPACSRRP